MKGAKVHLWDHDDEAPEKSLPIEADGTYATENGWKYARDLHGGVSNLDMPTVATLLGVEAQKGVLGYVHILNNKCWKQISDTAAVYNHNGNYRLVVRDGGRNVLPKLSRECGATV